MKVSICLFDQIRLEAGVERRDDGTYSITKLFPKFLGRPQNPHISIFAEPEDGCFAPHFTAGNRGPREFRRKLARIPSARVAETIAQIKRDAVLKFAQAVEPADLRALEDGGWTVHWVDLRALRRWMRLARRQSRVFKITHTTGFTLIRHLLKNLVLPTWLESFPRDRWMRLIALRRGESGCPPELRVLLFSPDGVATPDAAGNPLMTAPPGWYWYKMEDSVGDLFSRIVPPAAVEMVVRQVTDYLARYPRREPQVEKNGTVEVPPFVWNIFGFYASELFKAAVAATIESAGDALQREAGLPPTRSSEQRRGQERRRQQGAPATGEPGRRQSHRARGSAALR